MSHIDQAKRGQTLFRAQKTWDSNLDAFVLVNPVFFTGTILFFSVLDFKWHFESWPIYIILVPHPYPLWDS